MGILRYSMVDKPKITIQDLYPELSPEEQEEARQRLDAYLAIIKRIYERKHGSTKVDSISED